MAYEVVSSQERFAGKIIKVVTDVVRMPDGEAAPRDVVRHPGAVGVVAVDDDLRVLLIKQYRHALRAAIWEVPAGINDVDGEAPERTAARELHEETGWAAGTLTHLLTAHSSPGCSDERYEVFLGRDLREAADRPDVTGEELDLVVRWVPLAEAVEWVMDGRITNGMCVAGVLAAARVLGV